MKNRNTKQDVQIAEIKNDVSWIKKTFENFKNNEFEHLRQKVDWILWFLILGTLLSVALNYIFK